MLVYIFSQVAAVIAQYTGKDAADTIINTVCESLPSLLLFSLTLDISFFWIELSLSFKEGTESFIVKSNRLHRIYLISNCIIYTITGVLITLNSLLGGAFYLPILFSFLMATFTTGGCIFVTQGVKLYRGVLNEFGGLSYEKSKQFVIAFVLAIICLLIKIAYFTYIGILTFTGKDDIGEFFNPNKVMDDFGVGTVLYFVGEFGAIFSLILLLKKHTEQSKTASMIGSTVASDLSDHDLLEESLNERYHDISVKLI